MESLDSNQMFGTSSLDSKATRVSTKTTASEKAAASATQPLDEPIQDCFIKVVLYKLARGDATRGLGEGDPMREKDWTLRDIWLSATGRLYYASVTQGRGELLF